MYTAGDINITKMSVFTQTAAIDILPIFVSMSIYESIFTYGTVCDIQLFDVNDILGTYQFAGGEELQIELNVEGGTKAFLALAIDKIVDVSPAGAQKSKSYTLQCLSSEILFNRSTRVNFADSNPWSDKVHTIHSQWLKSNKPLIVEATKGPQYWFFGQQNEREKQSNNPPMTPFRAISLCRENSVSIENQSSTYVYFESRSGQTQQFQYCTIESLFKKTPVKRFRQSDATTVNLLNRVDDNILAYRVSHQISATDTLDLAGPRKIRQFNYTTHQFEDVDATIDPSTFTTGGTGKPSLGPAIVSAQQQAKNPPATYITSDWTNRPLTFASDAAPYQQAYLALLLQNSIKIRVVGDLILTPGAMIYCSIPNKNQTTSIVSEDPLISGNFLISRIHHKIGKFGDKPRYTCVIEGIKGAPNK